MNFLKNISFLIILILASSCAKKLTSTTSQKEELKPLIRVDGEVISREMLESIDKEDIDKIDVYKGESAITKFGEQAKDGAIDIYTKSYKELKKKELYNKLQDYLKSATGREEDFLFVLNGILIDETNIDQLLELDYAEIEIVEQITVTAANAIYRDKAKPNTILVTTTKK
jgi:bla regulator protein blaR1